jgi:hypothetical protein
VSFRVCGSPQVLPEGAIAQLGERLNGIQEVVGSIAIGSIEKRPTTTSGWRIRWTDETGKQRRETHQKETDAPLAWKRRNDDAACERASRPELPA